MVRSTAVTCDAGEAVIAVERFALTANNITYALLGDSTNYWDFFPADGKWGRIPVWGFGRVVSPGASALAADETLFGYLPMSTHLLMAPGKIGPLGLYDLVEHRAHCRRSTTITPALQPIRRSIRRGRRKTCCYARFFTRRSWCMISCRREHLRRPKASLSQAPQARRRLASAIASGRWRAAIRHRRGDVGAQPCFCRRSRNFRPRACLCRSGQA